MRRSLLSLWSSEPPMCCFVSAKWLNLALEPLVTTTTCVECTIYINQDKSQRTNNDASVDCYWHVQNCSTKPHTGDCWLQSRPTVHAWLAHSERSQCQHDHLRSKPDCLAYEDWNERMRLHVGYKNWLQNWGLASEFQRCNMHPFWKFQRFYLGHFALVSGLASIR